MFISDVADLLFFQYSSQVIGWKDPSRFSVSELSQLSQQRLGQRDVC